MLIRINSTNKNLSYILNKNPNSGLLIKDIRKGFIVGKFVDTLSYVFAFEEKLGQDSFDKDSSDSYLIYKSYILSETAISMLMSLFDCVVKDRNRDYEVGTSINTISIPCISIYEKVIKCFNCNKYKVTFNRLKENTSLFSLDITNNGSLIDLIRYTCLMLYIQTLKENTIFIEKSLLTIFGTLVSKDNDIPFSVRHMFRGALKEDSFVKLVTPLLCTSKYNLSSIGRNENQRFMFVANNIKYRDTVLDIGCNKGRYIKVVKPNNYIGVDVNEYVLEGARKKAEYLGINSSFYTNYKKALSSLSSDTCVLLIEVLEHISKEEGFELIKECINNKYVKQVLISTPNKDFNKYLSLSEDEVRYPDHLFEFTGKELDTLIPYGVNVQWGDCVDDCYMTLYKNILFEDK